MSDTPLIEDLINELVRVPPGKLTATMRQMAAKHAGTPGLSYGSIRRKYDLFQEHGRDGLIDGRSSVEHSGDKWMCGLQDYEAVNKSRQTAYNEMMADFKKGKNLGKNILDWKNVWIKENPGSSTPDTYPSKWVPIGASYQNLAKAIRPGPRLKKQCENDSDHERVIPDKCSECERLEQRLTQVLDELSALQINCKPTCPRIR